MAVQVPLMHAPSAIGTLPVLPSLGDWGKSASGFAQDIKASVSNFFAGSSIRASTDQNDSGVVQTHKPVDEATGTTQSTSILPATPTTIVPVTRKTKATKTESTSEEPIPLLPPLEPYTPSSNIIIGAVPISSDSPHAYIGSSDKSRDAVRQFIERVKQGNKRPAGGYTMVDPSKAKDSDIWKDITSVLSNNRFHLTDRNGRGILVRRQFSKALVAGYGDEVDLKTGLPQLAVHLYELGPTLSIENHKFNLGDLYEEIFKEDWKKAQPILYSDTAVLTKPRNFQRLFTQVVSKLFKGFTSKDAKPQPEVGSSILYNIWFTQTVDALQYSNPFDLNENKGKKRSSIGEQQWKKKLQELAVALSSVDPTSTKEQLKPTQAPFLILMGHPSEYVARLLGSSVTTINGWGNRSRKDVQAIVTQDKPISRGENTIDFSLLEGGDLFNDGNIIYKLNELRSRGNHGRMANGLNRGPPPAQPPPRYVTRAIMKPIVDNGGADFYDITSYKGYLSNDGQEIELVPLKPLAKLKPEAVDSDNPIVKVVSPEGNTYFVEADNLYDAYLAGEFPPDSKITAADAGFTPKQLNNLPVGDELFSQVLEKNADDLEHLASHLSYSPPLEEDTQTATPNMAPTKR